MKREEYKPYKNKHGAKTIDFAYMDNDIVIGFFFYNYYFLFINELLIELRTSSNIFFITKLFFFIL
jgi:hypothetical protein